MNHLTKENIRVYFDKNSKEYYFSIIDIIKNTINTTNPNNYWKVQKNRLKNRYKELVTSCNQVKLPSKDGKSYLTDTYNSENTLEIIKIIAPEKIQDLREFLYQFEEKSLDSVIKEEMDYDLPIDAYQDKENIFILTLLPNTLRENIIISLSVDEVIITGKRIKNQEENMGEIYINELVYGTFSRQIKLPAEINIDESMATLRSGILLIKLPKINKNLKRILKIQS